MLSFNMPQKIKYWPPNAQSNMDPDFKTGLFNKFQYQIHAKPDPNKKKNSKSFSRDKQDPTYLIGPKEAPRYI